VLERIRVPRTGPDGPGAGPGGYWLTRPTAPAATALTCGGAGIRCTIPEKADQVRKPQEQGQRRWPPRPPFDPERYKDRQRGAVRQ